MEFGLFCVRQIDVKVDADGRVLEFAGKQRGARAGWINAGIYLLSREMIQSIPQAISSLEKDIFRVGWVAA